MATKTPLQPQRQRLHYQSQHFRRRSSSIGDALLNYYRIFSWLHHRCAQHTHHGQQQRSAEFPPWRFFPGGPKPSKYINEASGMQGAAAGVVFMGKIASIAINGGHFHWWMNRGPLERQTDHSNIWFCCEGPQQSTISVWFEKGGSGVCSVGQMRANTEVTICISFTWLWW